MRLLGKVTEQCPNFKSLALDITGKLALIMIETAPHMLHRLTSLCLRRVEDEGFLNLVCEQSPNLEYLALRLPGTKLRKLKNHPDYGVYQKKRGYLYERKKKDRIPLCWCKSTIDIETPEFRAPEPLSFCECALSPVYVEYDIDFIMIDLILRCVAHIT